jgi:hypothetical protein
MQLTNGFSSLRNFLAYLNYRLLIANTYTVYLQRVCNCIIMDDTLAG